MARGSRRGGAGRRAARRRGRAAGTPRGRLACSGRVLGASDRDARAAGAAAAPASAALTCTDAVAKTNQVEVFAGRTVARSEDALLRPQEGMRSDR